MQQGTQLWNSYAKDPMAARSLRGSRETSTQEVHWGLPTKQTAKDQETPPR